MEFKHFECLSQYIYAKNLYRGTDIYIKSAKIGIQLKDR